MISMLSHSYTMWLIFGGLDQNRS